jgi:hypothetical protein
VAWTYDYADVLCVIFVREDVEVDACATIAAASAWINALAIDQLQSPAADSRSARETWQPIAPTAHNRLISERHDRQPLRLAALVRMALKTAGRLS